MEPTRWTNGIREAGGFSHSSVTILQATVTLNDEYEVYPASPMCLWCFKEMILTEVEKLRQHEGFDERKVFIVTDAWVWVETQLGRGYFAFSGPGLPPPLHTFVGKLRDELFHRLVYLSNQDIFCIPMKQGNQDK